MDTYNKPIFIYYNHHVNRTTNMTQKSFPPQMKRLLRVTKIKHTKVQIHTSIMLICHNVSLFDLCAHGCTGSYVVTYTLMRNSHLFSQFAVVMIIIDQHFLVDDKHWCWPPFGSIKRTRFKSKYSYLRWWRSYCWQSCWCGCYQWCRCGRACISLLCLVFCLC